MPGRLAAIWIKRAKGGPMDAVQQARAVAGRGLEGNANQGGARQVTLLSSEAWAAAADAVGAPHLDPRIRRANLLLGGVDLRRTRGRVLRVGPVRIRIRGNTRPCRLMEESQNGLVAALSFEARGGVYGEVVDDGEIAVGDSVVWEPMSKVAETHSVATRG